MSMKRLLAKLRSQTMRNIIVETSDVTIFFQSLIEVVNNIALLKTTRIKSTGKKCKRRK